MTECDIFHLMQKSSSLMDARKVAQVIAPMLPGGMIAKQIWWLTVALHRRTRGLNVSSDGVNKGLSGTRTLKWWTTLLAALITLSDLQISVWSWGNQSTRRFTCLQSVTEESSQGRRGQRWWCVGKGWQIYALLICISNFNGNEKPASSHLLG